MWAPLPSEPAEHGWWLDLETTKEFETRRWVEGIAADLRAERIERLRALAHEVDMRCAGALASDRWERIQRRRDEQGAVRYKGMLVDSFGAGPGSEVEHRGGGWVIGVR